MSVETSRAALERSRSDFEDENERTRVLDTKLSQLAAFCGVSISITGAVGASVIASGKLRLGFAIALGSVLAVAAVLLLAGVIVAFWGLSPKLYAGASIGAARERVSKGRLAEEPAKMLIRSARTYVLLLARARDVNDKKAKATTWAFRLVGFGFAGVVLALLVTVVGSVTA